MLDYYYIQIPHSLFIFPVSKKQMTKIQVFNSTPTSTSFYFHLHTTIFLLQKNHSSLVFTAQLEPETFLRTKIANELKLAYFSS